MNDYILSIVVFIAGLLNIPFILGHWNALQHSDLASAFAFGICTGISIALAAKGLFSY